MYWLGFTAEKEGLNDFEESFPVQMSSNFRKSPSGNTWPEPLEPSSLFAGASSVLSMSRMGRAMTRARPDPTKPAKLSALERGREL